MKKISLLMVAVILSLTMAAQNGNGKGNSGGAKGKEKKEMKEKKEKKEKDAKDDKDDVKDANDDEKKQKAPKVMKEKKVPAPVRKQFGTDYPNASGVVWTKLKGKWTATFDNTVVTYDANGTKQ